MNKAVFDIGTNSIKTFVYDNNVPSKLLYKSKTEHSMGELNAIDNKILSANADAFYSW